MKNIIVPIDYSEASLNAAAYAAALAKPSGARITLFHAFHLSVPSTGLPFLFPDIDEVIIEHNKKLDVVGEKLSNEYEIEYKSISRPSFVLDELNILFKQLKADLIVMGIKGNSFENKVFGSVTVSAMRQGNFPVLAVPANTEFLPIKKILLACDNSCFSHENKPSILKKIAIKFKAKVQVLHIESLELIPTGNVSHNINAPEIASFFEGIQHEVKFMGDDNVVQGIERGVKEYQPDILVMIPHKLGFWEDFFNKSTTDKIASNIKLPLLSLPNHHFSNSF